MANPLKQSARRNLRDAALVAAVAMPNAASTTVTTGSIDTGPRTKMAVPPQQLVAVMKIPALSTTILPDTKTMTISILMADDAALTSNVEVLRTETIVGAGGVGAIAAEVRAALPEDCARYLGGRMVSGANTTDASALSGEFALIAS